MGVFYGILFLKESLWVLSHAECKLFPYIHDMWVASNPLSGLLAYTALSALMPSASIALIGKEEVKKYFTRRSKADTFMKLTALRLKGQYKLTILINGFLPPT